MKKTLIFAIVEEGKAERLMNVAKAAGSHGGTILTGQGSGASGMLSLLGLTDFHREILLTVVEDSVKDSVWKALCECKIGKFFSPRFLCNRMTALQSRLKAPFP